MNRETLYDRIAGSLMAGALGDALGYEVEFIPWSGIQDRFGGPIRALALNRGFARISDDTQMTLFTGEGLLLGLRRNREQPGSITLTEAIYQAYLCWLSTQYHSELPSSFERDSELLLEAGLYARRAPGGTCLSALSSGKMGSVAEPINNSKGCGGVMRTAPAGFLPLPGSALTLGAEAAAITHGHPGGWAPGGMLADIVRRCIYGPQRPLSDIFADSLAAVRAAWDVPEVRAFADMVDRAVDLSAGSMADVDAIHALGGGWVGDEALAIAIFCCLRHPDSIPDALIAAVNHSGDSDSTGAICGNILGAYLGLGRIPDDWAAPLELRDLILRLARKMTDEAAGMMNEKQ